MRINFKNLLSIVAIFSLLSCGANKEMLTKATIKTNMGDIEVALLNETPLHKANFIEMVNSGFYNDIQFHRVIEKFVIQTGNQNSKNLDADSVLIDGGADHLVKGEFLPKYHHTRGAFGAAREGDGVNPERKSSGSHFYIVQGENQDNITDSLLNANNITDPKLIECYKTNGGTPHLDGAYTIFGYVIGGMDVVDEIAKVKTSPEDRPLTNMVINTIELSEVEASAITDNELYSYLKSE